MISEVIVIILNPVIKHTHSIVNYTQHFSMSRLLAITPFCCLAVYLTRQYRAFTPFILLTIHLIMSLYVLSLRLRAKGGFNTAARQFVPTAAWNKASEGDY